MSNTSFPALQNNPSTPPVSKTRMITLIGVFAAISTILMFIEMPLPLMPPFLKIDLSGVPILIIGFMYGPMPAIYVTIIKDLVHMLSSQTGCVGELADILVLSSFAVVSSLVFRKNPSQKVDGSRSSDHHRGRFSGKQIHADSLLFKSHAAGGHHRCLPCRQPDD